MIYSPGFFLNALKTPGQHPFFFEAGAGQVEAILTVPPASEAPSKEGPFLAILGHPHSLHGGTMENKVVTTLVRAFAAVGIPSIRFNFRGVGQSQGHFDAGLGESEDMVHLVNLWAKEQPSCQYIFAGFSFGSYVSYRAAQQCPHKLLISVAPPVHHFDYLAPPKPSSWVIVQGTEDEVVPFELVSDFSQQFNPPLELVRFEGSSHFFHGQLVHFKEAIIQIINQKVFY